jgi:hypothetical protein
MKVRFLNPTTGKICSDVLRDNIVHRDQAVWEDFPDLYVDSRVGEDDPSVRSTMLQMAEADSSDERLIVVVGPAGGGKTTFLWDWFLRRKEASVPQFAVDSRSSGYATKLGAQGLVEGESAEELPESEREDIFLCYVDATRVATLGDFKKLVLLRLRRLIEDVFVQLFSVPVAARYTAISERYRARTGNSLARGLFVFEEGVEVPLDDDALLSFCIGCLCYLEEQRPDVRIWLWLDNCDVVIAELQKACWAVISQWALTSEADVGSSLPFVRLVVALRPESFFRSRDETFIALPVRTVRVAAPVLREVLEKRSSQLFLRFSSLGVPVDTVMFNRLDRSEVYDPVPASSAAEWHMLVTAAREETVKGKKFEAILDLLSAHSPRRAITIRKNLLENAGIRSLMRSSLKRFEGAMRLSAYQLLDAAICGSNDAYIAPTDERLVVLANVFLLEGASRLDRDVALVIIPLMLQYLLFEAGVTGFTEASASKEHSVLAGSVQEYFNVLGPEVLVNEAIEWLVQYRFCHRCERSLVIDRAMCFGHLELLRQPAYLDNMAQVLDFDDERYGVFRDIESAKNRSVRWTVGYNFEDFYARMARTVSFLELLKKGDLVVKQLLRKRSSTAQRVKLWSVYRRCMAGYRERLVGLLESDSVPKLEDDTAVGVGRLREVLIDYKYWPVEFNNYTRRGFEDQLHKSWLNENMSWLYD